jgi:hypothetical protein
MCQAIVEYNCGRIKLASAAKEFGVPRNTLCRKAAEHDDNDCRAPVTYKRETALGFENEKKFMEHILKLQKIGYGLILIELKKLPLNSCTETAFEPHPIPKKVWQVMTGLLGF